MKAYEHEHIENNIQVPGKQLPLCNGYQQWIDPKGWLWYRGSFKMDDEYGYHNSFHISENRFILARTIYYIK